MKEVINVILITVGVILGLLLLIALLLFWGSTQPAVKEEYYKDVQTDEELELYYTYNGNYKVEYVEYLSSNERLKKYEIWYPEELGNTYIKYPLVVMANGTGVPASKYKAIFKHLASWGFVVVGNEEKSSWDGVSSSLSLDYLLKLNQDETSIFYQKIDVENVAIVGHSQGGVGAINAVTNHENGVYYKTIFTASTPHIALAEGMNWSYDVSQINIPYFMVAGTEKIDAEVITPLTSLEENYNNVTDEVLKVRARRVGTEHGDMLSYADGYMTAWLMYHLKNDKKAEQVFWGVEAEILNNNNWKDVGKNN